MNRKKATPQAEEIPEEVKLKIFKLLEPPDYIKFAKWFTAQQQTIKELREQVRGRDEASKLIEQKRQEAAKITLGLREENERLKLENDSINFIHKEQQNKIAELEKKIKERLDDLDDKWH